MSIIESEIKSVINLWNLKSTLFVSQFNSQENGIVAIYYYELSYFQRGKWKLAN